MLIGYARCSTADQNLDWQLDALTKNGCERIYQEKVTGTKKERTASCCSPSVPESGESPAPRLPTLPYLPAA